MFVRTDDNIILNLKHYSQIKIKERRIIAESTLSDDKNRIMHIATFDKPEEADAAFENLLSTIKEGKNPIWDTKYYREHIGQSYTPIYGSAQRNIPGQ